MNTPTLRHLLNENLSTFLDLQPGWDGYQAEPPRECSVNLAREVLDSIECLPICSVRVAPSVVGGVGITLKLKGKRAYLEVYNNGDLCVMLTTGNEDSEPKSECVSGGNRSFRELIDKAYRFIGMIDN